MKPVAASNLSGEIDALRRFFDDLAREADDESLNRFELRTPPMPSGLYWKLRWLVGCFLRLLETMRLKRPDPWWPALRGQPGNRRSRPLIVWAVGSDRAELRPALRGISEMQESLPGYVPVLITDAADFACFSRLGWLVEFLPAISGEGESYDRRKARFLARLYRGAPVLPVRAGLVSGLAIDDIRRHL